MRKVAANRRATDPSRATTAEIGNAGTPGHLRTERAVSHRSKCSASSITVDPSGRRLEIRLESCGPLNGRSVWNGAETIQVIASQ